MKWVWWVIFGLFSFTVVLISTIFVMNTTAKIKKFTRDTERLKNAISQAPKEESPNDARKKIKELVETLEFLNARMPDIENRNVITQLFKSKGVNAEVGDIKSELVRSRQFKLWFYGPFANFDIYMDSLSLRLPLLKVDSLHLKQKKEEIVQIFLKGRLYWPSPLYSFFD